MFNIGPMELILILTLALIIFGPKKLPEIGKTVGKSLREFRQASADIRREISQGMNEKPPAPGTPGTNGGAADSGEASTSAESSAGTTSQGAIAPHPPAAPPADAAPSA